MTINNQSLDMVLDRLLWRQDTQSWAPTGKQFWMKYEAAQELCKALPKWLVDNKSAVDEWFAKAGRGPGMQQQLQQQGTRAGLPQL
jgi:hypothetical protein